MWKSWRERDLRICKKDIRLWDICTGIGISVLFSYFFYRSIWALPFMLALGMGYMYLAVQQQHRRRLRLEKDEFKECILSVSASMRAGYAAPNAFLESMADMVMLYGADSSIVKELRLLRKGLQNSEPLEALLAEWGGRSELEEVREFADVFAIGKRGGGSMQEIMDATCRMISQSLTLEEEMETLLANKKLEQSMMNVMPFAVVFYLEQSSPGYFDMLYGGYVGRLIMTGCLVAYLFSYWLSKRILSKIFDER